MIALDWLALPRRKAEAGFTLPELVATMVVIGILAAVAVPRFAERRGFDAFGQAESIRQALRFAQASAIAKRRTVCVSISSGALALTMGTAFGASCSTSLTDPSTGAAFTVAASTGVSVDEASFSFNAVGRPNAAQSIAISGGGVSQTIVVEAETGYVH